MSVIIIDQLIAVPLLADQDDHLSLQIIRKVLQQIITFNHFL